MSSEHYQSLVNSFLDAARNSDSNFRVDLRAVLECKNLEIGELKAFCTAFLGITIDADSLDFLSLLKDLTEIFQEIVKARKKLARIMAEADEDGRAVLLMPIAQRIYPALTNDPDALDAAFNDLGNDPSAWVVFALSDLENEDPYNDSSKTYITPDTSIHLN